MTYFVVYKSKAQQRTTKEGRIEYYVDVGIFYDKTAMGAAMEWTEHSDIRDAETAWDTHCAMMRKEWPRRAGMDGAEAEKYRQVSRGDVTIDGAHTRTKRETQQNLFQP